MSDGPAPDRGQLERAIAAQEGLRGVVPDGVCRCGDSCVACAARRVARGWWAASSRDGAHPPACGTTNHLSLIQHRDESTRPIVGSTDVVDGTLPFAWPSMWTREGDEHAGTPALWDWRRIAHRGVVRVRRDRPDRGLRGSATGVATPLLGAARDVLPRAGGRWRRNDGPGLPRHDLAGRGGDCAGVDGLGDHPVHGQGFGRAPESGRESGLRGAWRLPVATSARLHRRPTRRRDPRRVVPPRGSSMSRRRTGRTIPRRTTHRWRRSGWSSS